jgi:hypothetical protein
MRRETLVPGSIYTLACAAPDRSACARNMGNSNIDETQPLVRTIDTPAARAVGIVVRHLQVVMPAVDRPQPQARHSALGMRTPIEYEKMDPYPIQVA